MNCYNYRLEAFFVASGSIMTVVCLKWSLTTLLLLGSFFCCSQYNFFSLMTLGMLVTSYLRHPLILTTCYLLQPPSISICNIRLARWVIEDQGITLNMVFSRVSSRQPLAPQQIGIVLTWGGSILIWVVHPIFQTGFCSPSRTNKNISWILRISG